MRRFAISVVAAISLTTAYALSHWALIEVGREVIVLRTEGDDGTWLESRLWIVDDAGAKRQAVRDGQSTARRRWSTRRAASSPR